MIFKKELLESNDINYLFLFPEDFLDDKYKEKFINFIQTQERRIA